MENSFLTVTHYGTVCRNLAAGGYIYNKQNHGHSNHLGSSIYNIFQNTG